MDKLLQNKRNCQPEQRKPAQNLKHENTCKTPQIPTANLQKTHTVRHQSTKGAQSKLTNTRRRREPGKIEKMTDIVDKERKDDRKHNNELWKQIQTTLKQKQDMEIPQLQQINARTPIGSTQKEVPREKHLILTKIKTRENKKRKQKNA